MKKLLYTVALVGMLVAPSAVQAQASAGPILALSDDANAIGIGGFLGIPLSTPNLQFVPNFIWFFPDLGNLFEINGDVMYSFQVSESTPVLPFAFGGVNIARFSYAGFSNTEMGINLGGGIQFRGALSPFAGAKIELDGGDSFILFGGLSFPMGSSN